jgi:pimeloyl-ACP methyl ester carboxylesterase
MDTVIPGLAPWTEVLRNPFIWHFAFHTIPNLPELLVKGHQRDYFDYFFNVLSFDPSKISEAARQAAVEAYSRKEALTAGFNWYRTFSRDAAANAEQGDQAVCTPVLYVRGEHESGQITEYVDGLRAAGLANVESAIVPAAGHFTQEEAPHVTWKILARFAGLEGK